MNPLKRLRITRLLNTLNSTSTYKRRIYAIKTLGKMGDPLALDALVNATKGGFNNSAATAAEALGDLGDFRAIPPLKAILCSHKPELRSAAAGALSKLGEEKWKTLIRGEEDDFESLAHSGDEQIIHILIGALGSSYDRRSFRNQPGYQALVKSKDPGIVQTLRKTLDNPSYFNKHYLIDLLGDIEDRSSVPDLFKYLQNDNIRVRESAVTALGKIGDPRAIDPLIMRLTDIEDDTRLSVAKALDMLGEPQWKDLIKGHYCDFERLGESEDQRILQPLIKVLGFRNLQNDRLSDAVGRARPAAAKGLGNLSNRAAVEALNNALVDYSRHVRKAAAVALSKLNDPFWENLIRGDDKDFSRLGESGDPKAIKYLIQFINTSDSYLDPDFYPDHYFFVNRADERNLAAEALGEVNQKTAVEVLIEALENTNNNAWVHFYTVRALGETGDPRAVNALIELFKTQSTNIYIFDRAKDEQCDLEIETIGALGKIGDKRAIPAITKLLAIEQGEIKKVLAENKKRKTRWKIESVPYQRIKDREVKVKEIIHTLKRIGGQEVIQPLSGLLNFQTIPVRKLAAETLIGLARKDFQLLNTQWNAISKKVTSAHTDHGDGIDEHSSSDCSHTDTLVHADMGIGLEMPPELKI